MIYTAPHKRCSYCGPLHIIFVRSSTEGADEILGKLLAGRTLTVFWFVAFYAIFANLPFWTASPLLGLLRNGLFCIDYVAVGVLALFLPRIFSGLLLLSFIVADLICGVSQTFYLSPLECLRSSGFLYLLSGTRVLLVGAVVVLALLLAAIAASLPVGKIRGTDRWIAAGCLVAFAGACVSVDFVAVVRGTGHLPNPFRLELPTDSVTAGYLNELWLARVPTIRLARNEIKSIAVRKRVLASETHPSLVPSASAAGVRSAGLVVDKGDREAPNLVLVLVESWGLATDSSVRNALAQSYFQSDLLARYDVSQGTVPFYGSTIPGESRELCDSKIGFHLLNASTQELQGCLPRRLAALGYQNIALHGMDGHMFNRSTWYRSIGFQEKWFRDQLRKQGLPDCAGAFTGICDAAVAQWIGRRLARREGNPHFVYWVTLNSHLPVPTPAPLADAAPCSLTPLLSQLPAFCSWFQLVSNVHQSVSKLAMTELARPTVFVVVGDHAPGFANPVIRSQFSSDVVPYVVLAPRQENQTAHRDRSASIQTDPVRSSLCSPANTCQHPAANLAGNN